MKNLLKFTSLLFFTALINNCSSNEDCTKTIVIPQYYFINNQSYSYDTTLEVSCDFPEPKSPEVIEPPLLENFSYEVLSFNYTPDTGNETSRLQFEIKLNNSNNYAVEGIPVLTIKADGLELSGSYSSDATIPCYGLGTNSSCTLTYDKEYPIDRNLGTVKSFELIDVKYYLTN